MLVFLLWWTLGSSLCWASAATIIASSLNTQSFHLVGLAVVTYWLLLGIVQWLILKSYFSRAYQWGLVTAIGGTFGSCLVVLGFHLFFEFLFKDVSINFLGGSSLEILIIGLIALITYLFSVGFLLGFIQNIILKRSRIKIANSRPTLTGIAWLIGVIIYTINLSSAKQNPLSFIISITSLGTIGNLIEGSSLEKVLNANRRF